MKASIGTATARQKGRLSLPEKMIDSSIEKFLMCQELKVLHDLRLMLRRFDPSTLARFNTRNAVGKLVCLFDAMTATPRKTIAHLGMAPVRGKPWPRP
jgi:hypothetical protein